MPRHRNRRHRPTSVLLAAVALGALTATGCAPGPSPTPTPTPLFSSEAEAFAAAEETYRAYVDALNEVDLADARTFDGVSAWLVGETATSERKTLVEMQSRGLTKRGTTTFTSWEVTSVDADSGEIQSHLCLDVSQVDLLDAQGTSVVPPTRPNLQPVDVSFRPAPTRTGLAIASSKASKEVRCDG